MKTEFAEFSVHQTTRLFRGKHRLAIVISADTKLRLYGVVFYGDCKELVVDSKTVEGFQSNKATRILQALADFYEEAFQIKVRLGEEAVSSYLYHLNLNFDFYVKRMIAGDTMETACTFLNTQGTALQ